jgi:formimidoylglutamate deiminase
MASVMAASRLVWTPAALIDGRWQANVLLAIDDGRFGSIDSAVPCPANAERLAGPVIPSLVDAHSHAFQRAMAGLAERRASGEDDFWSWRDRMYRIALRIEPAQLRAIAAQLYVELLRGGYTHVCEFHYLQHDPHGRAYDDPLELTWALAEAAEAAGIGLTALPTLYERAGFGQAALRDDQRRFATTPDSVWRACETVRERRHALLDAGVAIHSLRAASHGSIAQLMQLVGDVPVPIHIHVAEQRREVDECVESTGKPPIEWLCANIGVDARWHLVHATHATQREIDAIAQTRAAIVLCPSTEANLGDGVTDLPAWLDAGVPWSIGSDSQVTRAWPEELRWLEYGQRLVRQRRNVAAQPNAQPSTALRLFDAARRGSASAAGFADWGLARGGRADFIVLDASSAALLGIPRSHLIDALVFSSPADAVIRDVYVAGVPRIRDREHADGPAIAARFVAAMKNLVSEA